jgi:hypothetical protein
MTFIELVWKGAVGVIVATPIARVPKCGDHGRGSIFGAEVGLGKSVSPASPSPKPIHSCPQIICYFRTVALVTRRYPFPDADQRAKAYIHA